jgi:hypothetical protein
MKSASGYLTEDNVFFESKEEAELYEARTALAQHLLGISVDPAKFVQIVDSIPGMVRRYIDAYEAKANYDDQNPDRGAGSGSVGEETEPFDSDEAGTPGSWEPEPEVDERPIEHAVAAESFASLLELSSSRHGDVRDVGNGSRAEEVRDDGQGDGVRVRGTDAPDVRGSEDMATGEHPKVTETRRRDRGKDLRKGAMGQVQGGDGGRKRP